MSGEIIVRGLLVAAATVTAIAPATAIACEPFKQGFSPPGISISSVTRRPFKTVSAPDAVLDIHYVRCSLFARTKPQLEALYKACRQALHLKVGTFSGFANAAVQIEGSGVDLSDNDAGFWLLTFDCVVRYNDAL